jgi:MFS family permease
LAHIVPVFALLLSTAMLLTGTGLHSLLLPLSGAAAGFSTAELGLVGTGWAVGFIAGSLGAPIVVRRVGHIRAFASAAAAAAIIILLNGLYVVPLAWILLRVASGFCMSSAFMILESWLNERATNETRGTIFAIYLMISYLGITAGQLGVGLGNPETTTLFMAGAILFCLAVLPTTLSTAASPQPLARVTLDLRLLFSNSPVAFLTVLLVGLVNGAFGSLGAVWGIRIGLNTPAIALMMAITVVAGALMQLPAGRISDKVDRRYVIVVSALGAAIAGILIFVTKPVSPNAVLPIIAAYGALSYPLYGLAVAHANDYADPSDFVMVAGGLLLLYGVGTMVGPMAASALMTVLGAEALFIVTAGGHIVIAGYAFYRTTKRAPIPESVRDAYQPVPSGRGLTPETALLDPRAEDVTVLDQEPVEIAK